MRGNLFHLHLLRQNPQLSYGLDAFHSAFSQCLFPIEKEHCFHLKCQDGHLQLSPHQSKWHSYLLVLCIIFSYLSTIGTQFSYLWVEIELFPWLIQRSHMLVPLNLLHAGYHILLQRGPNPLIYCSWLNYLNSK